MSSVRTSSAPAGWAVIALAAFAAAPAAARADSVGPTVVLWYGPQQTFGTPGLAQRWVNVLGNVSDPDGVNLLRYTLNGGPQKTLSRGPDTRRLLKPGDFNVEIDFADLQAGNNNLVITARDTGGNFSNTAVTLTYAPGIFWPLPYNLVLTAGTDLQDVAQVVDGRWEIASNSVRCPVMGYDRVLAVGDLDWTDYEVRATITMLAIDPAGFQWPSVSPGFGITLRWPGHSNNPVTCSQPHCGWLPAGGTVWYDAGHNGPLTLDGDLGLFQQQTRTLALNVPYVFRMRVEDAGPAGTFYAGKVWPASGAEPAAWDLSGYEPVGDEPAGSAIFVAHHVDIRIANVSVVAVGAAILDCNTNGVHDPAEIAAGSTPDCNGSGVPDDCEIPSDCNTNGLSDACEIQAGSSADVNADLVPDACQVVNLTQATAHATIAAAIAAATAGDELQAAPARFLAEGAIDFAGKALVLRSTAELRRPAGSTLTLADQAQVTSAAGRDLVIGGALNVPAAGAVSLAADRFELTSNGVLSTAISVNIAVNSANSAIVDGTVQVESQASLAFSNGAILGGSFFLNGGTLSADSITVAGMDARLQGYGSIVGNTLNDAEVVLTADTQLLGNLVNEGTTTIHHGPFTLTGSLSGAGALVGDLANRAVAPRDANAILTVSGDLHAAPGARLLFPNAAWSLRVGGDFDVAVTDAADVDLAAAELSLTGPGPEQTLEALSADLGPTLDGLTPGAPGRFPLGRLKVGPTPTTVRVVDLHANAPSGVEAIYVDMLQVVAGATLLTDGHNVYYRTLVLDGTVDDPAHLVRLVGTVGDCDLDGDVDPADGAQLSGCLGGPGAVPPEISPLGCPCTATFDWDVDGDVDLSDFGRLQRMLVVP